MPRRPVELHALLIPAAQFNSEGRRVHEQAMVNGCGYPVMARLTEQAPYHPQNSLLMLDNMLVKVSDSPFGWNTSTSLINVLCSDPREVRTVSIWSIFFTLQHCESALQRRIAYLMSVLLKPCVSIADHLGKGRFSWGCNGILPRSYAP